MSDALPDAPLVLVVEDDAPIASLVCAALDSRGLRRRVCATAAEAITAAAELAPQVILLDLGLPDADGIEVVRRVRTWSDDLPIIVVSARADDTDKIGALDAGADDYLVKPFSVGELLARVRVALRRVAQEPAGAAEGAAFENGALSIDYASGIVRLSGEEVHLTPIEHRLLALLARNEGKVLTHQYLLEHAWGEGQVGDLASLRVIMASLRKKVGAGLIQTHVGVGYRMVQAE
ncbi:response regulator transcription factor [Olsenella sp. An293]|uniref:response regulator n=1 Tax=Olsenella sp. An293 TaxID=1965626 RepID=UPI000B377D98|nr:response regulator transcription factor [Olsenella sp. An293]OUO32426.1 DNA-binding response regulator [Olsenella sp. An293]